MRLSDANPRWVTLNGWASPDAFYTGVSFDCPCAKCRAGACPTCGHTPSPKRLAVNFWPPIDPKGLQGTLFTIPEPPHVHARTGRTFETLTLSPSIGFESIGHWHGSITNGEMKP